MTSSQTHVVFGAGALGLEIARQLAESGATVRIATRSGTATVPGVEPVKADLADPDSAIAAASGTDVIYFCAAPPYQHWVRSFEALQEGAIAAAQRSGAVLVAAENLYGYGRAGALTEKLPLDARTRKGAVRARMSHRLFDAHAGGDIRAVSGRASDFFGPTVRQSALGDRFWPDLLASKPVNWFGDPDARHSFTYLPDFAAALITLGGAPAAWGRAWHVPCPETRTVREIATHAAALAGLAPPRFRRTPRFMLRLVGLAVPAAGEMVEMEYAFAEDFVVGQDDWNRQFNESATDWESALAATVKDWRLKLSDISAT
ncbi:NAD-dependent epimerase/dehydratase family protein [Sphingobium algorifonticola]|nr:NAD-dependent epimerase/dehydratase family protein [Sphingobium algorifonticola]